MDIFKGNDYETNILEKLTALVKTNNYINPQLFGEYDVKRGLRDINGQGVLAGLTEISEVHSTIIDGNKLISVPGELIYRGISIDDLVKGFISEERYGFEEISYLLLFGVLPSQNELIGFKQLLSGNQKLPEDFVRDLILKAPSKDIMNGLARSVLALYSFDDKADDISILNVLQQCIRLIATFPSIAVYGYQAFSHYHGNNSLS